MWMIELTLLGLALVLLIPIGVFCIECLIAYGRDSAQMTASAAWPKIAVLVPAHNEAAGVAATLKTITPQLKPTDRLIVIADNCTDETAAIARLNQAEVIERQDTTRRGKGYALEYGLKFLAADPPEIVVIIDADCVVESGTIEQIAALAKEENRPVQATYLVKQSQQSNPKEIISSLAFTVKNLVRPLGLDTMGFPCFLTGTGMAFPWQVIATAPIGSANIVEDMQLAVDLALAGYTAKFCPQAKVTSPLPAEDNAAKTQRTRWEHGHLQTLFTQVPRLLAAAWQQKRLDLAVLALDLSVPPLSLLVMLWLLAVTGAIIGKLIGASWLPLLLLGGEGLLLLLAILLAWSKFARADIPLRTLLGVPVYVLWKIPVYIGFLVSRQTQWIRTQRDEKDSILSEK